MLPFINLLACVAVWLVCATRAELFQPQSNTWNSSFTLTEDQIRSLDLSDEAARNLEAVVRFEQTNWATGSVLSDPFYTNLPTNATTAPAGSIIKLEAFTNTSVYTIAPSLALSRFIYQSKTLNGTLVPVSAYILWPYYPLGGAKAAPLVSWGHGTAGLVAECAPSHMRNLLYQFSGPYALALAGYAVVATDFAGLGVPFYPDGSRITHQYVASPAGGNDILYAAQAARSAFPDKLTKEFVVFGHSQGGGTAWAAAQQQVELQIPGYLGTIAGSPVTNSTLLVELSGQTIAMIQVAKTMKSIWPDMDLAEMLTTRGQAFITVLEEIQGCSAAAQIALTGTLFSNQTPLGDSDFVDPPLVSNGASDTTLPEALTALHVYQTRVPFPEHELRNVVAEGTSATALIKDEFIDSYWARSFANLTSVGGKDFVGPMLVFHGANDSILPEALTALYVSQTCAAFPEREIRYVVAEGVEHVATTYATQQIWLKWLEERFKNKSDAGSKRSTPNNGTSLCTIEKIGDEAPRPLEQYQSKINWYLSYARDSYTGNA